MDTDKNLDADTLPRTPKQMAVHLGPSLSGGSPWKTIQVDIVKSLFPHAMHTLTELDHGFGEEGSGNPATLTSTHLVPCV